MPPMHELTHIQPGRNISSRDLFRRYMNRLGLKTDSEFLLNLTTDDEFEIWSTEMRFIGCSNGFMKASSYTYQQLAETDWAILFKREEEQQRKIVRAIEMMAAGQSFVRDVTDWHLVEETSSEKVKIKIRVKATGVAFDSNFNPKAFVAITQLKNPSDSSS
jgi:hypothetical protein